MTASAPEHTQYEVHHPSELALFHKNPRVGNVDVIAASLRANGQYKPILVNRGTHTGRPLEVLAGNHTLKAFRNNAEKYPDDEQWQGVHCWMTDVDDDRAARIVAADNRTSELGSFDDEALLDLLNDLPDLEGTGYSDSDFSDLEELVKNLPGENGEGDGGEGSEGEGENGEGEDISTGQMLEIVDVSTADPKVKPEHGSVWKLGQHTLIIAKLADEHHLWSSYLEGRRFAPYPEPYLTTATMAQEHVLLLVQPNAYMAGHLIDKHRSAFPDDTVEQVS